MPYLTQSRVSTKDASCLVQRRGFGWWKINGVARFCSPSLFLGGEQLWSYRTGKHIDQQYSENMSGVDMRKHILHDEAINLSMTGGVIVTGERESLKTLYPYDTGHNLRQLRSHSQKAGIDYIDVNCHAGTVPLQYFGPCFLLNKDVPSNPFPEPLWGNTGESTDDYQRANRMLAALSPTAPSVNLARALGELRKAKDIPFVNGLKLSKAITSGRGGVNTLGDEYLNTVFGTLPTINDLQRIARSISKAGKLSNQVTEMVKAQRKTFKRSYQLDDVKDVRSASGRVQLITGIASHTLVSSQTKAYALIFVKNNPSIESLWNVVRGEITWTKTLSTWINCAYDVFLEEMETFSGKLNYAAILADHFLGLQLDASLVYDLSPWTWMGNWFMDVGGFISRAEALSSDSVALRYGYISKDINVTEAITSRPFYYLSNGGIYQPEPHIVETHARSRWRATPYGFGLKTVDFSPQQWAILAALGFTRFGHDLNLRE